ncbi:MAG: SH3 domain-containing protein [Deltaproteobacteria bacterium]|nr:SH3 domain-containing protein [Deltaproteobacteria bacterium]
MGIEQRLAPKSRNRTIRPGFASLASLLSVFFAIALGIVETSQAQQASTAIVTGTERVFVRRGPGNEFPPFASIPSGSTVDVQEMRGEWARIITASGQVGYINNRFLSLPGEVEHQHPPTPHPTAARPSPRPSPSRPLTTPTPALPTATRPPTRTLPPSATRTSTRTAVPTRTPLATRTPAWTNTARGTTTPTIAPSVTGSPSASVAPASREALSARTVGQSGRDLEAEIVALKRELAEEKALRRTPESAAVVAAVDGCSDQVRTELARLAVAVESMQHRMNGIPGPAPDVVAAVPGAAPNATPTDSHFFPPIAIALGVLGFAIGLAIGRSHALRQERSRRLRLRF